MGFEPMISLRVTRNVLNLSGWRNGPPLRVVALADIHACEPWLNQARLEHIVRSANALEPDIIVLLGDYLSGMSFVFRSLPVETIAEALSRLEAPLGVHAILGNHDWWEDKEAQQRGGGPTRIGEALEKTGIVVWSGLLIHSW